MAGDRPRNAGKSLTLCLRSRAVHAADLREPPSQGELIQASDRQRREHADALMEHAVGIRAMARTIRKSGVKEVPLSEIKDDLSRYLREAEKRPPREPG